MAASTLPGSEEQSPLRRRLLVGAIVVSLSAATWLVFFSSSDEDEILELLDRLANAVRVDAAETNPAIRSLRLQGEFSEIFLKDVSIQIPELTGISTGRRELAQVAAQAGTLWSSARITLGGTKVQIDSSKTMASADGTATLDANEHGGQRRIDERLVSFRVEKIEGRWQIAGVIVSPKQGEK